MPTQPVTSQLTVMPGVQADIANTFDALSALRQATKDLEKKRTDARAVLAQASANNLAPVPPNVDGAVAQYQKWKIDDEALAAKIKSCKELRPIIEEHAKDLEKNQRIAVITYLEAKLKNLEDESRSEEGKEALLKQQITATRNLLHRLKTSDARTAKTGRIARSRSARGQVTPAGPMQVES